MSVPCQQSAEFLAAIARDHVSRTARDGPQGLGGLAEAFVACAMAVIVVVGLEIIDIDHDQGDTVAGSDGPTPVRGVIKAAAVGHACQRIQKRQTFQEVGALFQLQLRAHPGLDYGGAEGL